MSIFGYQLKDYTLSATTATDIITLGFLTGYTIGFVPFTGSTIDEATQLEVNAETITGKYTSPSKLGGWLSNVLTRTGLYFSKILGVKSLELGNSAESGSTRTIEAKGSDSNVGIQAKLKGNSYFQLNGVNYVLTDEKLLTMDTSGNILASYNIGQLFVAEPPTTSSPGEPGQIAYGSGFLYVYVDSIIGWFKLAGQSAQLIYEQLYVAQPATYTSTIKQGQNWYNKPFKGDSPSDNVNVRGRTFQRAFATTAVTSNYTITLDDYIVLVDATAGNIVVTPPAYSSFDEGLDYYVMRIDNTGNTVNITPTTGQIGFSSTKTLTTQGEKVHMFSNKTNWYLF